jgi:Putative beta-barrel porin-2, OmpL-like. bbp2
MQRNARGNTAGASGLALGLLLGGLFWVVPAGAQQPADTLDKPIELGNQQEDLGEIDRFPLQISGFGVGDYTYAGRTGANSFSASKVGVALFREITNNAYIFGQLTTALRPPEGGGEPVTETEIDNLLVSVVPNGASNLAVNVGKLDLPIGFERDDEPLNLLVSPSFNFELARPVKMVGIEGTWSPTPGIGLEGFAFNGWDTDIDPNHGKSGGARVEYLPRTGVTLGLSGLYGSEGDQGATNNRYLLTLDYAVQPSWDWVVAGEANLGGDRGTLADGSDANWRGGMVTVFHRLSRSWGVAARAEVFRDADGARTGVTQTLESYTIAPSYSLGVGREGIFANVQHTTIRIPRLQLRGEVRLNHSSDPVFETSDQPGDWNVEYRLQLVTTF